MTSKITTDVLDAYLNCQFKASMKLNEQQGTKSDYEIMLAARRESVRQQALDRIGKQHPLDRVERGIALNAMALKRGSAFILDAVIEDDCSLLCFDGLKRVEGPSKLGAFHYVPLLFLESHHIRKEQRLLLGIYGAILARLQGKAPEFGIVWHGKECRASKVRLDANRRCSEQLLASLRQMRADEAIPPLILNDHCPACEFRNRCHAQAISEDNLSLLRGMGVKEIKKLARKGILTVTQLSHTFRPRRKGKRAEPGSHKRHHSLQAMAIRDKTIYVLGTLQLPTNPVKVFLDIEADPEEQFVYLIGMIVVERGVEQRFSFWGNGKRDEPAIFGQFLTVLSHHDDFVVFSYGSYEQAALKRMQTHAELKQQIDRVLSVSVNVLSIIYSHIYFPTYSNGLKDIGSSLGFSWAEPEASGLQSISWRAKWEATQEDVWKQILLQYNLDDCAALKVVTDHVYALATPPESLAEVSPSAFGSFRIANVQEIDNQARARKWGRISFVHADYEFINGCAYFSYQRQRVYVQTNGTLRKNRVRPTRLRNRRLPVTHRVEVAASECEHCHSADVKILSKPSSGKRGPRGKRVFDFVGSKGAIKLRVIECHSKLHHCCACGAEFVPDTYRRVARYFHGVKSWAMYQHIAHQLSFGTIKEMIDTFFNLPIPKPDLHRFKAEMALYYEPSRRYLWDKLLAGSLLHVDETQFRLKGGKTTYVWAFTNLEEVVYLHRPNREGEFLRELLKDFHGVLVSDFYAAYDSIECPQQKCVVHLIRDMNDDLLDNPFDEDLQLITKPFGALLRPIVATIGEHGLRKRHLRPFKRDVDEFFQRVEALSPSSDVAQALRNRLLKYRQKLFTFLDYDGVPWNNNNAENAIKRFALYRAHASGMMRESGVANFLTLLSICQTCKYKNLNFWRFLLSRQQYSADYVERKSCPTQLSLEVSPEGSTTAWEKLRRTKGCQPSAQGDGQLYALEAAVKVLEDTGTPMTAEQLIEAMAAKGYWTSPHSRTPAVTLYSAILREIQGSGTEARFRKVGKRLFTLLKSQ